jgi:MFS family permease
MATYISIVGVSITMYFNVVAFCVGRFIWGIGCGIFSVSVSRFIDEVVPSHLLGIYGVATNSSAMFG